MIAADTYVERVEDETRRAVVDPRLDPEVERLASAARYLLEAAGCEDVAEHVCAAEVLEAVLSALPWDDIASKRAEATGLTALVNAADGLIYHHHITL